MEDERRLAELAGAALDGIPVDWDAATVESGPHDRATVRELQVLAEVVALHRREAGATPRPRTVPLDKPARLEARIPLGLWGPLTLLEKVGTGAFGEVYRAWDPRLEREVALKLLSRTARDNDVAATAVEEGRLLARVRHPHVVTVYGAAIHGGRVGIWTEFVCGRTLEESLREQGRAGGREAALVGMDLCQALSAVHGAGVLHRDVKTQNVMREEGGRLVLMDFGTGQPANAAQEKAAAGGTPLYMAPELFQGAPATTTSDVYSLGVLLFRVLTGSYPVTGETFSDVREAHRRGQCTRLRDVRPDLAADLVGTIERALEPDPARRFRTAGELESALSDCLRPETATEPLRAAERPTQDAIPQASAKRPLASRFGRLLMATGILAVLGGLASLGWWGAHRQPPPGDIAFAARDWILVGAFDNQTGENVLDGTVEYALAQDLANSPFVNVVPRERIGDALTLMKKAATTRLDEATGLEVCQRDGGIRGFLTGRVEKVGSTYTISATLLDPASRGRPVLSAGVQVGGQAQIFSAVHQLSDRIRAGLGEARQQIEQTHQHLEKVTTPSLRALHLYTQAMTEADGYRWAVAANLLEEATAADPGFASAHILLAHAWRNLQRPEEDFLPHAEQAFRLADTTTDRERYFILGSYYEMLRQNEKAAEAYETLVQLYPDDYWGTMNLVMIRGWDAQRLLRLVALRPNDFSSNVGAARSLLISGQGLKAAEPYVMRATSLIGPQSDPFNVAWIRLLPAFDAWLHDDLPKAIQAVIAVKHRSGATVDEINMAANFDLAMGRVEEAHDAYSGQPASGDREVQLAWAAFWRGDRVAVQQHLREASEMRVVQWPLHVGLLLRVGMPADARQALNGIESRFPGHASLPLLKAQLVLVTHPSAQALSRLEAELPWNAKFSGQFLRAAALLADGLVRQGEVVRACQLLERATADRSVTFYGQFSGAEWLALRARLIPLYVQIGRNKDADAIRAELSTLLACADPDFIILSQLTAGRVRE